MFWKQPLRIRDPSPLFLLAALQPGCGKVYWTLGVALGTQGRCSKDLPHPVLFLIWLPRCPRKTTSWRMFSVIRTLLRLFIFPEFGRDADIKNNDSGLPWWRSG